MALTEQQQKNIGYIMDWFDFANALAAIRYLYSEPSDIFGYAEGISDPDQLEEGHIRTFARQLMKELYEADARMIAQIDFRVIRDRETEELELLFVPVEWGTSVKRV